MLRAAPKVNTSLMVSKEEAAVEMIRKMKREKAMKIVR